VSELAWVWASVVESACVWEDLSRMRRHPLQTECTSVRLRCPRTCILVEGCSNNTAALSLYYMVGTLRCIGKV
jgi:hypothetical protein